MQDGLGSQPLPPSENGVIQAIGPFALEFNNGVKHNPDSYLNRVPEPILVATLNSTHHDNNVSARVSNVLSPLQTTIIGLSSEDVSESPTHIVQPEPQEEGAVSTANISGNIVDSYDQVDASYAKEVTNNSLPTATAVEQKAHALENLRNLQIVSGPLFNIYVD
jgi:hypothetical protein